MQLRIACALRLGSTMCHPHTCICGTEVVRSGTQGLSCKRSAGRLSMPSEVNDLIKRGLSSAKISSVIEPTGVSRDDRKRPDGPTIFPWKKGRCLVWDFTCSDTLAPSHIASSSKEVSKIAENKENFKLSKYSKLQESYLVVPVCVETLG